MAILTPQACALTGTQVAYSACASGGDSFANDERTYVRFKNSNASTRTVTFASAVAFVDKPGFGRIPLSNLAITVPGSGTNGGEIDVGPFPSGRFNDGTTGRVGMTYSTEANLSVAVVKLP